MAPSHAGVQPVHALVYLLYGSTALWMLAYSSFSTLPFRMLLVQQALVVSCAGRRAGARGCSPTNLAGRRCSASTASVPSAHAPSPWQAMVLLVGSGSMCEESEGMRAGYAALHALLQRAQRAVERSGLLPASWPAVVSALAPSMPWCPASEAANASRLGAGAAAPSAATAAAQPDAGVQLCVNYQLAAVLLGGFVLSTWLAYRSERRSRVAWLRGLLQLGSDNGAGARGGGGGGGPDAAAAAAAAWRREVELELVEPLPDSTDFLLQLALPCLLCIAMVARCIL